MKICSNSQVRLSHFSTAGLIITLTISYADIHELLTALPVTIVSVPPATSILRQLVSMLPEVDSLSATLVSSIVEVLNRWRRAYPDDLQICLMESLEELISAIQAEPSEEITKVGEHFVSIFVN